MNAVRGLLRDLVERKLWPVAVLLLAAALAVPVYLGRSSGDDAGGSPPVVADQSGGKISRAAVKLDDQSAGTDPIGGVRNPFKQQHLPKSSTTDASAKASTPSGGATTPSSGSDSGSGSGSGDGSTTPVGGSGGSGTTTPTTKPETDSLDLYHLTVRVGRADGTLKTLKDVARLSPLPSVDDPFMVYTGVLSDGETAVFLLSSDAKATGDGHCKPKPTDCESVEVKKGDSEFFDLTVDGQPVQYELDVLDVTRQSDASDSSASSGSGAGPAKAASAERHSNAGAALLRKAHVDGTKAYKNADAYRWVPERGVLVRTPKHGSAQASVTGATAASAADAAATLPGQPVWHWQLGA